MFDKAPERKVGKKATGIQR